MNLVTVSIIILFTFFLIYTFLYIIQWLCGLYIASNRLAKSNDDKQIINRLYLLKDFDTPKISILIPAFNEEACILDTIHALQKQSYQNIQIIIVDDGSTDHTKDKLRKAFALKIGNKSKTGVIPTAKVKEIYESKEDKLTFIQKENGGKADALNCGLNYCDTQYCVVLDADTQLTNGSLEVLLAQFLLYPNTVICAGAVTSNQSFYTILPLHKKGLIYFQMLEYFRTFYMQRIMLDKINGNIVVSGAFAMFDSAIVKAIGGYRKNTIGEDMEIAMRIHSFCASQKREYEISYCPEAKCYTQFPFQYRDYIKQRRRWHIGMMQSMKTHKYMCGNYHYGWIGVLSGTLYRLYELYTPWIEIMGFVTFLLAYVLDIINFSFAIKAFLLYLLFMVITEMVLMIMIQNYQLEKLSLKDRFYLFIVAILEFVFFHPLNMIVKIMSFLTYHNYSQHWGVIKRSSGSMIK